MFFVFVFVFVLVSFLILIVIAIETVAPTHLPTPEQGTRSKEHRPPARMQDARCWIPIPPDMFFVFVSVSVSVPDVTVEIRQRLGYGYGHGDGIGAPGLQQQPRVYTETCVSTRS